MISSAKAGGNHIIDQGQPVIPFPLRSDWLQYGFITVFPSTDYFCIICQSEWRLWEWTRWTDQSGDWPRVIQTEFGVAGVTSLIHHTTACRILPCTSWNNWWLCHFCILCCSSDQQQTHTHWFHQERWRTTIIESCSPSPSERTCHSWREHCGKDFWLSMGRNIASSRTRRRSWSKPIKGVLPHCFCSDNNPRSSIRAFRIVSKLIMACHWGYSRQRVILRRWPRARFIYRFSCSHARRGKGDQGIYGWR